MADQNITQGQATEQVKADESVENKSTQVKVEEPKEDIHKKEIAGLNQKISEYQKQMKAIQDQLEAEKLSKLSADEQSAALKKKADDELATVQEQTRSLKVQNALLVNGLSVDFAGMITGKTDEDIINSIKVLKEKITSEATTMAEAERNKLFGNGGKDIKQPSNTNTKLEFTREDLQTREGRELYKKNLPLGAKITN